MEEQDAAQPLVEQDTKDSSNELLITVGDLVLTGAFQLDDGRMEVLWAPVDHGPDEAMEYLAKRAPTPIAKTRLENLKKDDQIHYLFTETGLWKGVRIPKILWRLYVLSHEVPEAIVDAHLKAWAQTPLKQLISKDLVDSVKAIRPWATPEGQSQ